MLFDLLMEERRYIELQGRKRDTKYGRGISSLILTEAALVTDSSGEYEKHN